MSDRRPENQDQLPLPWDEVPLGPTPAVESRAPEPVAIAAPQPKDWRKEIPSVSQLTRRLRGHIENSFFDVWVRGEVSNFKKNVSGHAYFNLKDATAQISVVLFRPQMAKVKFELKDGCDLLVHGKITVYEQRGNYQMVGDTLEPVGVGALQLAFEQLKERLQREGLFEVSVKQKLPTLPRRIGIITSATGAAVRDILKVLSRRYPNLEILIIPSAVQGEKASAEICAALKLAERWNREKPERAIEILIVGRGGGSLEDLWCFNEEPVARALFSCRIPTISAVGHEIDFTIADFVADVRAPTPSAAAEMVVPRKDELILRVDNQNRRLVLAMQKQLEQLRLHLDHLSRRLVDPREKIRKLRVDLVTINNRLLLAMQTRLLMARQRLETLQARLQLVNPQLAVQQRKNDLQRLEGRLMTAITTHCLFTRRRLEASAAMLQMLSPLQVIARGYSLTQMPDGRIIRQSGEVNLGEQIYTRLATGTLRSQVMGKD